MQYYAISELELKQFHMAAIVAGGSREVIPVLATIRGRKISYTKESQKPAHNNGSTPCRFFSRDKVFTGQSADGGSTYQSVPWCNHEPSQRAVP